MANEVSEGKVTSEWIGGFCFWLFKCCKAKLENQLQREYKKRNIWTGYIVMLIVVTIVIYLRAGSN